jgi:1-acyl-sn-glycerol-3-phosphate acyltransferase
VLIAPNHMSYLDPPLVGGCSPRELHYLGRKSLFRTWWSNWALKSANVVPIGIEGQSSASGVKTAVRLLEQGHAVVIFPEGARSDGQLLAAQSGIGWIALKTGAPVLPVRIWGTNLAMPRKGKRQRAYLEVKFGRLLHFDRTQLPEDHRAASEVIARAIMREIEALKPNWDSA